MGRCWEFGNRSVDVLGSCKNSWFLCGRHFVYVSLSRRPRNLDLHGMWDLIDDPSLNSALFYDLLSSEMEAELGLFTSRCGTDAVEYLLVNFIDRSLRSALYPDIVILALHVTVLDLLSSTVMIFMSCLHVLTWSLSNVQIDDWSLNLIGKTIHSEPHE